MLAIFYERGIKLYLIFFIHFCNKQQRNMNHINSALTNGTSFIMLMQMRSSRLSKWIESVAIHAQYLCY